MDRCNALQTLRLYLIFIHQLALRSSEVCNSGKSALDLIDGRCTHSDKSVAVAEVVAILRPILPSHALNDDEMRILIQNIFTGVEINPNCSVNLSFGMLTLRQHVPYAAWQVLRIVQAVRTVVRDMSRHSFVSSLERHVRVYIHVDTSPCHECVSDAADGRPVHATHVSDMSYKGSVPPVHPREVYDFCIHDCAMSCSESQLIVQYVTSGKVIHAPTEVRSTFGNTSLADIDGIVQDEDATVDVFFLYGLIFAEMMPSDVEYPLLAAQLAEATQVTLQKSKVEVTSAPSGVRSGSGDVVGIDVGRRPGGINSGRSSSTDKLYDKSASHTGAMALLHALKGLSLVSCAHQGVDDLDFGALIHCTLTELHFNALCDAVGAWTLGPELRRRLFVFMRAPPAGAKALHDHLAPSPMTNSHHGRDGNEDAAYVCVRTVVRAYRQFLPPVSAALVELTRAAVVQCLARTGDELVYVKLFFSLRVYGAGRVPLEAYIAALRQCGVMSAPVSVAGGVARHTAHISSTPLASGAVIMTLGVPDIALEWLRLEAPTRVDLLYTLCHPVLSGVQAVVKKVFAHLDDSHSGRVPVSTLLSSFDVNKITTKDARARAALWRSALMQYLDNIGDDSVDYDLFAYFCFMLSAGVVDEPAITMMFWQCFGLSERAPPLRRTST